MRAREREKKINDLSDTGSFAPVDMASRTEKWSHGFGMSQHMSCTVPDTKAYGWAFRG